MGCYVAIPGVSEDKGWPKDKAIRVFLGDGNGKKNEENALEIDTPQGVFDEILIILDTLRGWSICKAFSSNFRVVKTPKSSIFKGFPIILENR